MKPTKIKIIDEYDGFVIIVDKEYFRFDQEDSHAGLVEVFREIVGNDVKIIYEESY